MTALYWCYFREESKHTRNRITIKQYLKLKQIGDVRVIVDENGTRLTGILYPPHFRKYSFRDDCMLYAYVYGKKKTYVNRMTASKCFRANGRACWLVNDYNEHVLLVCPSVHGLISSFKVNKNTTCLLLFKHACSEKHFLFLKAMSQQQTMVKYMVNMYTSMDSIIKICHNCMNQLAKILKMYFAADLHLPLVRPRTLDSLLALHRHHIQIISKRKICKKRYRLTLYQFLFNFLHRVFGNMDNVIGIIILFLK